MIRRGLTSAAGATAAFLLSASLYAQAVSRDLMVGPELLFFQDDFSSQASVAGRASGGLAWRSRLGADLSLAVEPRAGLRVLGFDDRTSTELVMDAVAALASPQGRRLRWEVEIGPKLRAVADPPELPAYLDPGRFEFWAGAALATPVASGWEIEARGSGGLVRYTPDDWRVLDRSGYVGSVALLRALGPGLARLTLAAGGEAYVESVPTARNDTRWSLQLGWLTGEPVFLQLEADLAWNSSSRAGFDYRSRRAALLLSAPLGRGSVQFYAAVAAKTYSEPGPPGARVAPSDRDTGSFVILQVTRPLGTTTNLHLRGEWSRSETGFRDLYFQRLGLSALVSFRPAAISGS